MKHEMFPYVTISTTFDTISMSNITHLSSSEPARTQNNQFEGGGSLFDNFFPSKIIKILYLGGFVEMMEIQGKILKQ